MMKMDVGVLQVVQEYERAVIFRLGRLLNGGAKGPGERGEPSKRGGKGPGETKPSKGNGKGNGLSK